MHSLSYADIGKVLAIHVTGPTKPLLNTKGRTESKKQVAADCLSSAVALTSLKPRTSRRES